MLSGDTGASVVRPLGRVNRKIPCPVPAIATKNDEDFYAGMAANTAGKQAAAIPMEGLMA
jgi:hypothetical protein